MQITTTATLAKTLTVKREKRDEDSEAVIGHLKFGDAFVSKLDIDFLLGVQCEQDVPWAHNVLFTQLGAPRARLTLSAPDRALTASVRITGVKDEEMHVAGGTLKGIVLTLEKSGALLSGEFTWEVAGDEVSDLETMLGKECRVDMSLTDGGQADLLSAGIRAVASLRDTMAANGGGSLSVVNEDGTEEVVLKVDAA